MELALTHPDNPDNPNDAYAAQRAADFEKYGQISPTSISLFNTHRFDIFDESTWIWDAKNVATSLGNTCRFNGNVYFYSVAEHCVRVMHYLFAKYGDPGLGLLGLHHEDEESIVGDVVSPHKRNLQFVTPKNEVISFKLLSENLRKSAWSYFGLDHLVDDKSMARVGEADGAVYALESNERPKPGQALSPRAASEYWLYWNSKLMKELSIKMDNL